MGPVGVVLPARRVEQLQRPVALKVMNRGLAARG
jgi:hypothetical protein